MNAYQTIIAGNSILNAFAINDILKKYSSVPLNKLAVDKKIKDRDNQSTFSNIQILYLEDIYQTVISRKIINKQIHE
jgi:hypothetical protein